MISCKCTPIESCTAINGCPSECGNGSTPASAGQQQTICTKPNWSMYDQNSCEHNLYKSTLCEITDISGFAIEYYVLNPHHDYLWGEDPNSNLSYPSLTKCIYAPETETTILEVFGLTADDTLQYMTIPKAIFSRDLSMVFTDTLGPSAFVQPRMGDVVRTLWNDRHYEISAIDEEQDIFMAKKFTWNLVLRPYRFSEQSSTHREVHTGIPDDPFASIVSEGNGYEPPIAGESDDLIEHTYFEEMFGDNKNIETESNDIVKHRDPDESAFGVRE